MHVPCALLISCFAAVTLAKTHLNPSRGISARMSSACLQRKPYLPGRIRGLRSKYHRRRLFVQAADDDQKSGKSALDSLNTLFGSSDGEEEKEKSPALGTVEALYKEAERASVAAQGEKGNEEAIRKALRQPKPQAQEKKEEEPEYESFQEEISDIGPKVQSYAKALLALPLLFWPFIVGIVVITGLTVFLSDGSFGGRAPPPTDMF